METTRSAGRRKHRIREGIWHVLPNLTFWPTCMHVLGRLGLRRVLKRTYCRLFGPAGGVLELEVAGKPAKFYVHTQFMADSLSRLQGEGPMLEVMLRTLTEGDCAYDIGAEMGLYTSFLARAVGERGLVIAFEPASEPYERLQDNLMLNGLTNVRVFRAALCDHSGRGTLFSGAPGYAPTLRNLQGNRLRFPVAERVTVAAGDRLVMENKLRLPKAVKIDAEGCELAVIRGLARTLTHPTCQLLCCEIHPAMLPEGVTPESVIASVKPLGFRQVDVKQRGATLHAICRKLSASV